MLSAPRKDDAEARDKAEIQRMRAVITEITAENLELRKKGFSSSVRIRRGARTTLESPEPLFAQVSISPHVDT
jgi:hypothetical protein